MFGPTIILSLVFTINVGKTDESAQILGCPEVCVCNSTSHEITVDCNDRKLMTFPYPLDLVSTTRETLPVSQTEEPMSVRFLANRNTFGHLLKNKLGPVLSRLSALEVKDNLKVMEVPVDLFDTQGFLDRLHTLKLGPIRISCVEEMLARLFTSPTLIHLSVSGDVKPDHSLGNLWVGQAGEQGQDVCVLDFTCLPSTVQILKLNHVGKFKVVESPIEDSSLAEVSLQGAGLLKIPRTLEQLASKSLRILDLSYNYLTQLWQQDVDGNGSNPPACVLVALRLRYNRLQNLSTRESHFLQRCGDLKYIDLSHNALLAVVEQSALRGFQGLTLDLSATKVKDRSLQTILDSGRVSELRLYRDDLNCSCDLLVSRTWFSPTIKGSCRFYGKGNQNIVIDLSDLEQYCSETLEVGEEVARPSHSSDSDRNSEIIDIISRLVTSGDNSQQQGPSTTGGSSDPVTSDTTNSEKQEDKLGQNTKTNNVRVDKPEVHENKDNFLLSKVSKDKDSFKKDSGSEGTDKGHNPVITFADKILTEYSPFKCTICRVICLAYGFLFFAVFVSAGHSTKHRLG